LAVLLAASSLLVLGCSSGEDQASSSSGGAPSDGGPSVGKPGAKDGDETDVDCGGASAARCADGKRCQASTDCASGACAADGTCAAPSPTDGVKNGDETDVDCGGSTATKCAPAKGCKAHADCVLGACREGVCAMGKSCRAKNGGGTCGAGEIGPDAKHEDCCIVLDVPRPAASGGPYKLDKYLVTAGRMRAFIEELKGDVKSYVNANPPPGWDEEWTKSVPGSEAEAILQLGVGQKGATSYGGSLGPGCFVEGKGAPAYWFSPEQQQASGDIARAFTQDELDTKVLNCATRALFAAFCHWDGGGRLPTYDERLYAVDGGDDSKKYPWGNDTPIENFAAINFNYFWPRALADGDLDRGAYLPAPGRFPQGKGPFGHMDLAGAVETFTAEGGVMQNSFQEKELAYGNKRIWNPSTRHWAIGARCAR